MLGVLSTGIPGLAIATNDGGLQCATAVAAAATATATQAAVPGTEHCPVFYSFSCYDADLAADTYVKVEIIRDNAAAGGGKTVLYTHYYWWDITQVGVIYVREESVWLPAPIITGTSGETLDFTVTTAGACDAVTANILSIPITD
jgi:hypothetical protein